MLGTIQNLTLDYKDNKPVISLKLDNKTELKILEELKEDKIDIDIKKHREKRSLNSNNYCWELCTKIADVLRSSKEEVYLQMLKRYGQSEMISVLADIDMSKYLKYYEEAGESTLNNKLFKHYKVYKGSSEFDSKEFSILLDGIISEAKELNISTIDEIEKERLIKEWVK